jgi:hypothetical protein
MENKKAHRSFLALLVSADAIFILLYTLHLFTQYASHQVFSLKVDGGYGDVFQYVKWFWIALMLFGLFVEIRHAAFFGWAFFFGYLLIDDSCQLHEKLGTLIAQRFELNPVFNLKAQDLGELTVGIFTASIFFLLLGGAYLFSTMEVKKVSKRLVSLVAAIVFFGVGADMLHSITYSTSIGAFFGILEDGGEMLAASVVCWYVYTLFQNKGAETYALDELFIRIPQPWTRRKSFLYFANSKKS